MEASPAATSDETVSPRYKQYRQPYRGRVRSGCLTCRTRKVKCDERRPGCDNCKRTKRECVYKSPSARTPISSRGTTQRATKDGSVIIPRSSEEAVPKDAEQDEPRFVHAGRSTGGADEEALSSLSDSIIDVRARLQTALRHQFEASAAVENEQTCAGTPSALISRDIELTTTMDILASREMPLQQSFAYFVEVVECPVITPFDSINWQRMKVHVVELAKSEVVLASTVIAVTALYKAYVYGLPLSKPLALYESAKGLVDKFLDDIEGDFNITLVAVFLLCLYEYVFYDITTFLQSPSDVFMERLQTWTTSPIPHPILSTRISIWLKILFNVTKRGGGAGVISDRVYDLLPCFKAGTSSINPRAGEIADSSSGLFELLSTPIFEFYFHLQLISGNIADLSHYRRSRTTSDDQEEVISLITAHKSQLHTLWADRSAVQHQTPSELSSHLAHKIAHPLIALIKICEAAYYTELIELDRVMGDPVSRSSEAAQARSRIREIVDGSSDIFHGERLSTGYLRSLFLFAIECMDKEENRWAVENLRKIRDPIGRSDFFAAFGEALGDEQSRKDRRVTSKYFCIRHFGVAPPYL